MTAKKSYQIGDTVWIYGLGSIGENKLTKGRVVHACEIPGYDDTRYIIAVATEIEDLLEIRTWATISEDDRGPVGGFRDRGPDFAPTRKLLKQTGFNAGDDVIDENTVEVAAAPESKPKRKRYYRKRNEKT